MWETTLSNWWAQHRRRCSPALIPGCPADVGVLRRQLGNIRCVTAPTPYLHFPGTAREALTFYGDVFGCAVQLHSFAEFNRTDGPAEAIAHGYLTGGPVALFAADVSGDQPPFRCEGMMLPLFDTAAPATLRTWFLPSVRRWPSCRRPAGAALG
jgi:hypothetical protein